MSAVAPLERIDELLPAEIRRVVDRRTPIVTLAGKAAKARAADPGFVRADIGQVVGVDPSAEVLYGPPVGLAPVREAVAELYGLTFGDKAAALGITTENVALCTGAAEALSLLFRCFGGDGRKVGLPTGHWENYLNGVDLAGGTSVVVDFFDQAGELAPQALERAIRAEGLSMLVANFPCNPTGAVLSAQETAQLAAVAQNTGIVLVADEVYARLRYDGVPPQSLLPHAPGHVVAIGSASKEYQLPGGRAGWVVSSEARLTDHVLRRLIRAGTASPNVLAQRRLLALVETDLDDLRAGRPSPRRLEELRDAMRERRDALLRVLGRHAMPCVGRAGRKPEGTIFLVAALPPWWNGPDDAFCEAAIDGGWFSAIPGSAFGLEPSVRFAFGSMTLGDILKLDSALDAMRQAQPAPN